MFRRVTLKSCAQVQLSSYGIHGPAWFLQISQLVWWTSMVPSWSNCGRHRLSGTDDHIRQYSLHTSFTEYSRPHSRYMRFSRTGIQVILSVNKLTRSRAVRSDCLPLTYHICSGFTSIATYFLTKELWSEGAGLFAACFIAIVPGYISRSVAGSYDNEGIAIFALQFTYYLWVCIIISYLIV